jgi:hypothetical protein
MQVFFFSFWFKHIVSIQVIIFYLWYNAINNENFSFGLLLGRLKHIWFGTGLPRIFV